MFKAWVDYNVKLFINRDVRETIKILIELEELEARLNVYYPELTVYISDEDTEFYTVEKN